MDFFILGSKCTFFVTFDNPTLLRSKVLAACCPIFDRFEKEEFHSCLPSSDVFCMLNIWIADRTLFLGPMIASMESEYHLNILQCFRFVRFFRAPTSSADYQMVEKSLVK